MPTTDAGFDAFQSDFMTKVFPKLGAWGIPAGEYSMLSAFRVAWVNAWDKAKNKDSRSRADVRAKIEAKKAYVAVLRKFIREWIAFNSKVTNAEREWLGLKVKDTEPTPVGAPVDSPIISINFAYRDRHIVSAGPNPENEQRNAKPKGVASIELRMKVGGAAPVSAAETVPAAVITHSPYTAELGAHRDKTVWWIARYLSTRGIPGPWSEAVGAQVTGI
ncbi:MAG: hypothetical protein HY769_06405 [Candidatus Stahlbacteria bacterium]|nr:hypothetical protein [Candidatus Stahlbacteria bacterium]